MIVLGAGPPTGHVGMPAKLRTMIEAVVFDLDGVLIDSERLWDQARRQVVAEHGGRWRPEATTAMQGMSSGEWSNYLRNHLGVDLGPRQIADQVVDVLLAGYEQQLPLVAGALEVVQRIGRRWPLALASSANRQVIDRVLAVSGLQELFGISVSSDEVARGKPEPDVYLEAARRLGRPPRACVAVEDSANGIRAALAAGLRTIAVPNRDYPPPADVLGRADRVVQHLADLTVELLEGLDVRADLREGRLDEEEIESFPASDPHADWAGS